ncbi:MAG: hypothetical protein ACPGWR_17410 [Ardenticatenaceae bacterium]
MKQGTCPAKSDTYPVKQGTCPAKSDTYPASSAGQLSSEVGNLSRGTRDLSLWEQIPEEPPLTHQPTNPTHPLTHSPTNPLTDQIR